MEQNWQIPRDPPSHLLAPLNELKGRGFNALLQTLFLELKVGASPWARSWKGGTGKGDSWGKGHTGPVPNGRLGVLEGP